jgi:threonine synthase
VVKVAGTISDAGREAARLVQEEGCFDLSTLKEPYRAEGKKTMGLELWEELPRLPDAIIYPTGGGTGLIGLWKAFDELEALGLIRGPRPRLIAVQPEGCAPVVEAMKLGLAETAPFPDPNTIAAGLRVPAPYAGREVLEVLRASGGTAVTVDDDALRDATRTFARDEGMLVAPEAGAALAALPKLLDRRLIGRDEQVVLFLTGGAALYLDVLG